MLGLLSERKQNNDSMIIRKEKQLTHNRENSMSLNSLLLLIDEPLNNQCKKYVDNQEHEDLAEYPNKWDIEEDHRYSVLMLLLLLP
jgi:hypothetical protein